MCNSRYVMPSKSRRVPVAQSIRTSLLWDRPIKFVSHWGVGSRNAVGPAENEAIAFLTEMMDELREVCLVSVNVEFFITDTHARLNQFPTKNIESYCASALELLISNSFSAKSMSSFLHDIGQWSQVEPIIGNGDLPDISWQIHPGKLKELSRLAHLRSKRSDPLEAATRYYIVNLIENIAITEGNPGSLFLSYSAPGMDFLLPATHFQKSICGPVGKGIHGVPGLWSR